MVNFVTVLFLRSLIYVMKKLSYILALCFSLTILADNSSPKPENQEKINKEQVQKPHKNDHHKHKQRHNGPRPKKNHKKLPPK